MSSSEAELPAITAAGSPGRQPQHQEHQHADDQHTGMTAAIRRQRYISMTSRLRPGDSRRSPARLLDVPEHRDRRAEHALDSLAHRERLPILADVDVGGIFGLAHLHRLGDRLLLGGIGLAREGVAQLLQFRVARPAERRLVAAGVDEGRGDRVEDVGRDPDVSIAFQPPLSGGSFLVRRATTVCQSIDCMSTLKPAFSISDLATGARLVSTPRSVDCSSTTGVPS